MDPTTSAIAELDRQVERGSLFTQAVLQRGFQRISAVEALVSRLIDVLAAQGLVTADELGLSEESADDVATADERDATAIGWPTIALREDDPEQVQRTDAEVDCSARMHVCHAVCCKLKFPLSAVEVEAGHVKWDIGHPYVIRHESDGYCTHHDATSGGCTVYENRPGVCRRYSCVNDSRIWKDFDGMVLNHEWLDEHLAQRDFYFEAVATSMEVPVALTTKP